MAVFQFLFSNSSREIFLIGMSGFERRAKRPILLLGLILGFKSIRYSIDITCLGE